MTNAAGCVTIAAMPTGRLIDLVESLDRDRIVNEWLTSPDNEILARAIATHILDRYHDARDARMYMEVAVRNFHRDMAMAVIILTEAGIVNRKLAGEKPETFNDIALTRQKVKERMKQVGMAKGDRFFRKKTG